MLRVVVVAIGVACLIGALFLVRLASFAALELGVFGILILAGTFFEKHYRERRTAGSGFQKTRRAIRRSHDRKARRSALQSVNRRTRLCRRGR